MPRRLASPVPTITASGVAIPSAHGQEMTSTVTAVMTATFKVAIDHHTKNVAKAINKTAGTKMRQTRSAYRWIGACVIWAS